MKKIMFNDKFCLTQAVLAGKKTITRRNIKHPKKMNGIDVFDFQVCRTGEGAWWVECVDDDERTIGYLDPPYKEGEIVAIAQSYKTIYAEKIADFAKHNYHTPREDAAEKFKEEYENTAGWSNKMFVKSELMPHHIQITGIKVERLQDISEEDCLKEGIISCEGYENAIQHGLKEHYTLSNTLYVFDTPIEAFAKLIDRVGKEGDWDKNPYVFAYSFELVD